MPRLLGCLCRAGQQLLPCRAAAVAAAATALVVLVLLLLLPGLLPHLLLPLSCCCRRTTPLLLALPTSGIHTNLILQVLRWFWMLVGAMREQQRAALLRFWTSLPSLPCGGFGGLPQPLKLVRAEPASQRLPQVGNGGLVGRQWGWWEQTAAARR